MNVVRKSFLVVALAGSVALVLGMTTTSHAVPLFTANLAGEFAADYVGSFPVNKVLPSASGGSWTFYAAADTQGTSTVVAGDIGAGAGDGWDDPGQGIGGWARGGAHGLGPGAGDAVVQHTLPPATPSKIDYLVPVTALYDFTLLIQQTNFEAARQNRFRLFKNDFSGTSGLIAGIDATLGGTGPAPGVTTSANGVALTAGDKLTLIVDGGGAQGNGTGTFTGINLMVTANPIPEPATGMLAGLGVLGAMAASRRRK